MKRLLSILLLASLLLTGCGNATQETSTEDFLFYFPGEDPHKADGFVTVSGAFGEDIPPLGELIRMYFSFPVPPEGRPVLPAGWKYDSYGAQNDGLLTLNFSGETASPIEESMVLASVTRTFLQIEEIRRVKICPPKGEPMILSGEDLLLEDMGMFPREEIALYFPDEQLRYLRRVAYMVDSVTEEEKPAYILNRLLNREGETTPNNCIPQGTRLLGIQVENGVCTLDLSSEFAVDMPNDFRTARLAVYSIVNSLTELEGIQTVDIMVAHSPLEQIGLLDLSQGLQRDDSFVSASGGFEGSIYLYDVGSELLVEVPVWIREGSDRSIEEQLLSTLLSYEGQHFVRHSIPRGTALLSVHVAEDTCVVDLTAEFTGLAENYDAQKLAVRSIIATLSTLSHIHGVEILVEGNRLEDPLREIRQTDPSWFAESVSGLS